MNKNGFLGRYKALLRWQRLLLEVTVWLLMFSLLSSWLSRHLLEAGEQLPALEFIPLNSDGSEEASPLNLTWPSKQPQTLMYFFAPWCSICRISMPGLQVIDQSRTRVVAVALDFDSHQQVADFVDQVGFNGEVLLGTPAIAAQFRIRGYPSYYLVNQNGVIEDRDRGLSTPPGLWLKTR